MATLCFLEIECTSTRDTTFTNGQNLELSFGYYSQGQKAPSQPRSKNESEGISLL